MSDISIIYPNENYLDKAPFRMKADRYLLNQTKYDMGMCLKDEYLKSQKRVYKHLLDNPESAQDMLTLFIKKPDELDNIRNARKVVLPNRLFSTKESENIELLKRIGKIYNENYPYSGNIRAKLIKIGRIKLNTVTKVPQGIFDKIIRKLKVIL